MHLFLYSFLQAAYFSVVVKQEQVQTDQYGCLTLQLTLNHYVARERSNCRPWWTSRKHFLRIFQLMSSSASFSLAYHWKFRVIRMSEPGQCLLSAFVGLYNLSLICTLILNCVNFLKTGSKKCKTIWNC